MINTPTTPLHLAAIRGKVHVAKLLIRFGADLNPRTPLGSTPLYYSCTSRHYQLTALLLRSGADVHAMAQVGNSCRRKLQRRSPGDIC